MTRPFARLALSVLLALGVGLVVVAPAPASTPAKSKKPTIKVAETDLGQILVTTKGRTLYVYDPDGTDTNVSKCVDQCADAWPAYTSKKKPKAGKGLEQSEVGIGGDDQVVYADHLLYEFSGDTQKGQTSGQGLGGVWHVVGVDGEPITG